MYEYKFVEVEVPKKGLLYFNVKLEKHREIIEKYSKEGWRFVQVNPIEWDNYGFTKKVELIFERKIEK